MSSRRKLFDALFAHWGPQYWWPGETPFEIVVGAVLTQNTAWSNVEKAIANLKGAGALCPERLSTMPLDDLATLLRPSGYFNVKALRLQSVCRWYRENGGYEALQEKATAELRVELLGVHGIGCETADDILLYAMSRPVFVVDAYTRRLCGRLGLSAESEYERLRAEFEAELPPDAALFGEFHALIVAHAKHVCRKRPLCAQCCLRGDCAFAVAGGDSLRRGE